MITQFADKQILRKTSQKVIITQFDDKQQILTKPFQKVMITQFTDKQPSCLKSSLVI